MLLEQKTLKQLIKNKSNIDVNNVKNILQLDPTLNIEMISDDTEIGKYGEWLLGKLYKNYSQLTPENKNTIKSDLQFYDYQIRSKRIPSEYDNIYKIKSIEELHEIVNKIQGDSPITQDPVTVAIGNHQFKTVSENPFELLKKQYYNNIKESGVTKWLVFNPETKEESIVAGHDTKWCTARDDGDNQWYTYIYEGNTAWIFLLSGKYKIDNPDEYNKLVNEKLNKICIIVERGECKNKSDDQFELKEIPEIGEFIENKINDNTIKLANHDIGQYQEGINYIISGFKNKNNGRLNEKFQIYEVSRYGWQIKHIENPSKDVQLQQVKQNGYQIEYIETPSEEVQLQQVKQNGIQIQLITNPSKNVQLQQILQNYKQTEHIANLSEDVKLQQVSQDGLQIQYIKNPSEEIKMQQVSENGNQIQYIKNPSEEIKTQQVSQDGLQIQYIKNPNEELKLQQVSENGLQIQFITNPSENIQLQQIKNNKYQYFSIYNCTPKQRQLQEQLNGIAESTGYISKLLDVN